MANTRYGFKQFSCIFFLEICSSSISRKQLSAKFISDNCVLINWPISWFTSMMNFEVEEARVLEIVRGPVILAYSRSSERLSISTATLFKDLIGDEQYVLRHRYSNVLYCAPCALYHTQCIVYRVSCIVYRASCVVYCVLYNVSWTVYYTL